VVSESNARLGIGLYTPSEAARLIRAHPQAIGRWLYSKTREPVFEPTLGREERVITFLDLIQTLAIRAARQRPHTVPLPKIREAIRTATEDFGLETPLAYKHKMFFFDGSIIIQLDRQFTGLTGRDRGQAMMPQIVEPFMDEIDWSDTDGLARIWTPRTLGGHSVVLDPKLRFGQPTIQPGGLLVEALADAAKAEGSVEAAAEAFEIDREAVVLATKYQDYLSGIAS